MMHTKQTIAIIGATGNVGDAISKNLAEGNYRLLLKGDSREALQTLLTEIKNNYPAADVVMETSLKEAGWEADIIMLAVPQTTLWEVATKIKAVANQKIVVAFEEVLNEKRTSNQMAPTIKEDDILEQLLPNSKLIKVNVEAFTKTNNEANLNQNLKANITGHDDAALDAVAKILTDAGFHAMVNA